MHNIQPMQFQQPQQPQRQDPLLGLLGTLMPFASMLFPGAAPYMMGANVLGNLFSGKQQNPQDLFKLVSQFNPYANMGNTMGNDLTQSLRDDPFSGLMRGV